MRKNSRMLGLWIWYQISASWRPTISASVVGYASPAVLIGSVCHAICVSDAQRRPGPDDVEVGERAGIGEREADFADLELLLQPPGDVGEGLDQRVAVDLEPDRFVDLLELGAKAQARLDLPAAPRR